MVRLSEVDPEQLYTPGEVADMFRVDPKTVVRWIKAGKFENAYERTAGGHHRVYGYGIKRYVTAAQNFEEIARLTAPEAEQ